MDESRMSTASPDNQYQLTLELPWRKMTNQQQRTQKISSELQDIRVEVQRLRALAKHPRSDDGGRLKRYIAELDDKRRALAGRVSAIDAADRESVNDVMRGLEETRDRLAIAREAAKARFH
jgi:hypothetical protein